MSPLAREVISLVVWLGAVVYLFGFVLRLHKWG